MPTVLTPGIRCGKPSRVEEKRNRGGRPPGRNYEAPIAVRLTPEQGRALRAIADLEYEGNVGAVVRALIDLHLRARAASAA